MSRNMVLQRFAGVLLLVISFLYPYVPFEDGTYLLLSVPLGISLLFSHKKMTEWGIED